MALYRKAMETSRDSDLPRQRELLQEALAASDRNSRAWMALGALEFSQGNLQEAATAFHRASRLEPARHEPRYNLGAVLESAGQYAQAAKEYEIALKRAPDDLEVIENLARCYIRTGSQPAKAKELIDQAVKQESRPEWVAWLNRQSVRLESAQRGNVESQPTQSKGDTQL
jgi:Flp pilus assembly protein TadD